MKIKVTMLNSGGELDHTLVSTGEEAAQAAVDLIMEAGELYAGDKIVISNIED